MKGIKSAFAIGIAVSLTACAAQQQPAPPPLRIVTEAAPKAAATPAPPTGAELLAAQPLGGGADTAGRAGAGNRGAEGTRRGHQTDCARTHVDRKTVRAGRVATAATAATSSPTGSLRCVYRAARTGSRLQRCRAAPRVEGAGLHRRLDAGAAFRAAPPRAAQMVGASHGALRDRAGRAGPGRLRPVAGVDWRAARDAGLASLRLRSR